jgi:YfiH family protein
VLSSEPGIPQPTHQLSDCLILDIIHTNAMPDILPALEWGTWRAANGLIWWDAEVGPASLCFTTRRGGVSAAPYDTLNLGLHVGDQAAAVIENRNRFWSEAAPGASAPVIADQVHGTSVAVAGAADTGRGWHARETSISGTDALVTREAGVPLAILAADCAPIALVAPGGVLGVVHAGWRGLAGGVLEAALRQMVQRGGGVPSEYQAAIGPCIRGCCYEVGEEVWRDFPAGCLSPSGRPNARRLDLMAAVYHRLQEVGLLSGQIHPVGLCTACHPDLLFSHRGATQQGLPTTGRMALLARLMG